MKTVYARIVSLVAIAMLAACAAADVETPPAGDGSDVEASAAPDAPEAELTSGGCLQCVGDEICHNPAFGNSYCAQPCYKLPGGEDTCPGGYECTRPMFWNKWRCTFD